MHNGGAATWVRASHIEARRVREEQDKRNEVVLYSKERNEIRNITPVLCRKFHQISFNLS